MLRRRVIEDNVSHDRWLVSYADFITLLFAFFVVMYSISQVNEGKYKVLSETLTEVFNPQQFANTERTLDPFQIGEIAKSNPRNVIKMESSAIMPVEGGATAAFEGEGDLPVEGGLPAEFKQINQRLDKDFSDLLQQKMITVRGNEEWLEVELKSSLLFGSGDASLSQTALELLGSIAEVLKDQTNPIRVEGFTDDIPINTPQFPSNWELSTARASAVVQLFIEEGLAPSRLAAIGYGEFQPVTDNNTEQGRSDNRRVVLMISKTGELRPELRELTTTEQLLEQGRQQQEKFSEINIIIPGVDTATERSDTGNSAAEKAVADPLQGVKTIQLEDGGLLFTNDNQAGDNN